MSSLTRRAMLALQAGGGSGGDLFELIGEKVFENVGEWTDASNWDFMDTLIDVKSTDYAFGFCVITCDSAITTSTEWGATIAIWSRTYSNKGTVWRFGSGWQKGSSTLSFAAMAANPVGTTSYGVTIQDNTPTIKIARKAHASACPKIRAGTYTVKVYGMKSL